MPNYSAKQYDADFRGIHKLGLTWLPWVGNEYANRPADRKLLVVGESHYVPQKGGLAEIQKQRQEIPHNPDNTRDIIEELIGNNSGAAKTLIRITELLFGSATVSREKFWSDCAFYNLVQEVMDIKPDGKLQRPSTKDYMIGWKVFSDVVKVVKPSHCLFIGVSAADRFNDKSLGFLGKTHWTEKLGNTWGRTGNLQIEGMTIELMFVKHLGSRVSPTAWHGYLKQQHPAFMEWMLKAHSDSYKYTP